MAVFEIESGGKVFEVEAPDQKTALAAMNRGPVSLGDVGAQAWKDVKKFGSGLVESLSTLPQRAGQVATEYGQTGEYNPAPIVEAATLGTPVNPAIRAGDRAIPGVAQAVRSEKPVPSAKQLAEAGGADIKAAKQVPLDVSPAAVGDLSKRLQQKLFDDGIHPVDAEKTFAKLKELETAPAGSVFTPANLQSLRESFGTTAQNFNQQSAKDQLAASRVIKALDEFLPSLSEKDIVAGTTADARAIQDQLAKGRGNYAAAMRSNDITGTLDKATTGVLERAELRAQAANSGRNIDNTIRQKVAAVLEKPKEVSGLSQAEMDALEQVVVGGPGRNAARQVGNWLGGGGGLGQTSLSVLGAAGGGAVGGIPGALALGAAPMAVGTGARTIANLLAKRDLRGVDELMRKRSPMYENAQPNMTVVSPERRAAIARLLLMDQAQQ